MNTDHSHVHFIEYMIHDIPHRELCMQEAKQHYDPAYNSTTEKERVSECAQELQMTHVHCD